MSKYDVRDVVCDYGVYEDDELKLIVNSRRIALQIVRLLEEDNRIYEKFSCNSNFVNVIRCKACKYCIKDDSERTFCELGCFYVDKMHYCSNGELAPKDRSWDKF